MSAAAEAGPRRDHVLLAAVLLVCALLYFLKLGDVAFLGKDEPKNAQTVREMYERGDWVTTTLAGKPWYDKPILYYWTGLVGYHLFGPSELGARIGPAIAALLTVWMTFLLGRRLSGGSASAGALAALILGTGLEFFWFARTAVTDALLACGVTGAIVAYLLAREGVRPALNIHLAWACAGVAVLAKGPIGMLLPLMVIGADALIVRDWKRIVWLRPLTGALVLLAVAGPWYALVLWRSEGQFYRDFILHYNVERFATGNLPHQGPIYYYLPILLLGPFPWSVFLPTALIRIGREFRSMVSPERERMRFLLLWIGVPLVFFSFAGSKLPSYLLPTFPAVAILLAREIRLLLAAPGRGTPRGLSAGTLTFGFACAGLTAGGYTYLSGEQPDALSAILPLGIVLMGCALWAAIATLARRRRAIVSAVGACAVLAPVAMVLWGLEPAESYSSAREVSLQAMDLAPPPGQLLSYRFYDNTFYFYTDATVEELDDRPEVEERVKREGTALLFVRRHDLTEIRASTRFTSEILGARGRIHLLRLTSITEPPEDERDDSGAGRALE